MVLEGDWVWSLVLIAEKRATAKQRNKERVTAKERLE